MELDSIQNKMRNSFAFRFNKLERSLNPGFSVELNSKKFTIPVVNAVGQNNHYRVLAESTSFPVENWFFKLIQSLNLPVDSDFLDVGVNIGQSLLAFKSCYNNTYWGFEPNPACVFFLDGLTKINNLKKVNIIPVGLSSAPSIVRFYHKSDNDSAATILKELREQEGFLPHQISYVPVFSLDSLKLDINHISLIKIDVEGAELDVVKGMSETLKKHQPTIICEVLDYNSNENKDILQRRANDLLECFQQMNYKAYRIVHKKEEDLSFEAIDTIQLQKWTPESLHLNDYLFLPGHITSLPY